MDETKLDRCWCSRQAVTVWYKGLSISVPVTVGLSNDQFAEITSGLQEGDQVVVQGTRLRQTSGGGLSVAIFGR